jgi:hypothetical protein
MEKSHIISHAKFEFTCVQLGDICKLISHAKLLFHVWNWNTYEKAVSQVKSCVKFHASISEPLHKGM